MLCTPGYPRSPVLVGQYGCFLASGRSSQLPGRLSWKLLEEAIRRYAHEDSEDCAPHPGEVSGRGDLVQSWKDSGSTKE